MNSLLNNRQKAKQTSKQPVESKPQPPKKVENKKKPVVAESEQSEEDEEDKQKQYDKLNKAKQKKAKKAEQEKAAKSNPNKCNVCNEAFASKTKLFDHIKKSGHASAK